MLEEDKILFEGIKSLRLLNEAVDSNIIEKAINNQQYVYLYYSGDKENQKGARVVKPFVYGTNKKNGNTYLRAWEESGKSHTFYRKDPPPRPDHDKFTDYHGTSPGWRMFRIDKIITILPTGKRFNVARDGYPPKYKAENDKVLDVTSCIPLGITGVSGKTNTITTDGFGAANKPDEIRQKVKDSSFTKQSRKFYDDDSFEAMDAGYVDREIAKDDIDDIMNRIRRVGKKNIKDYIVAINDNGDYVPVNVKFRDSVQNGYYVGDLKDLYDKFNAPEKPMSNDFYDKAVSNVINKTNNK